VKSRKVSIRIRCKAPASQFSLAKLKQVQIWIPMDLVEFEESNHWFMRHEKCFSSWLRLKQGFFASRFPRVAFISILSCGGSSYGVTFLDCLHYWSRPLPMTAGSRDLILRGSNRSTKRRLLDSRERTDNQPRMRFCVLNQNSLLPLIQNHRE
jgi:hypothetical protein